MLEEKSNEDLAVNSEKAFNGPVYFLIREQAKSVVAIKELQARLTVLEDLQQRLMQAVHNVQYHLIFDKASHNDTHNDRSYGMVLTNVPTFGNKHQLREACSSTSEPDIKQELLNLVPANKTDSKGESINKDSGVVADYKESSANSSYVHYNSSERLDSENDELLKLLDIIDQKSLLLLQQVEDIGSKPTEVTEMQDENEMCSIASHTNSYTENVITQRQLYEVKADRDELKQRLSKLETATDTVVREKQKLQKKLETVVSENQQLQMKIQNASHSNEEHGGSYSLKPSMAEIQKATIRRKYMQYSEMSRKKVANVLKETHVLELQRQLLTYIMENDLLQAKLEQSQPNSLLTLLKMESQLKKDLQNANEDKKVFEKALREKHSEVSNLKKRIKDLEETLEQEKVVKNFGMGSTDDWRQPSEQNPKGQLNMSPLGFGDFSKTQSLPAVVCFDCGGDTQFQDFGHELNTKNFTNISLNSSNSHDKKDNFCHENKDKILVDLTDSNDSEISNPSTLLHLRYWNQPALSADWSTGSLAACSHHCSNVFHQTSVPQSSLRMDVSAKLVNGHLCWKGNMDNLANDLDSVCTEFDPLNSTISCENFVDSLNLSIPLKPTRVLSQLSSIGDSLHSASLDLGCASSAVWHNDNQKLSSANSVDGMRKLLVDSRTNFYKNRTTQNSAQGNSITSAISGKSIHPRTLNMMECMSNNSDNKLL